MNTEVLVILVSAIMGLVTVFQTLTKGWERDKENFHDLQDKYEKILENNAMLLADNTIKETTIQTLMVEIEEIKTSLEAIKLQLDKCMKKDDNEDTDKKDKE